MLPPLPPDINPDQEFPILRHWHFFNHAGVSPLPARTAAALRHYADLYERDSYLTGKFYKHAETVRANAAKLINASPEEIAFTKNTSEGLAWVANGLDWTLGQQIISAGVEYPSNVYPWMDISRRFHLDYTLIPEVDGRIPLENLLAAVTPRTRMIALSHVQFASGFRSDLAAIGRFSRDRGILFCVDAIQSCGALPIDVRAMNIDFLSAGAQKWLLGPEGVGIFFCRRELIPGLRAELGWANVVNAQNYLDYDLTLRDDARRFECGGLNLAGILALGATLELMLHVGPPTMTARIKALTDLLVEGLQSKGYRIVSSRRAEEWSGIVTFTSPTHDHSQIIQSLEAQRIIIVLREKRLRCAPHFYNSESQIQTLLNALPS